MCHNFFFNNNSPSTLRLTWTILLIFVTQNIADGLVDEKLRVKTVGGYFKEVKWFDFDDEYLTFRIYNNHFINHAEFTLSTDENKTVEGFNMRDNKLIEFLPVKIAEKFPNLAIYQAFKCSVKSISAENFHNLGLLEALYIQYNQIEAIEEGVFDELMKLKILKLSHNKINFVGVKLFKNLQELEFLYLGHNELKTLDFNLKRLVELKYFSIAHNQLLNFTENHFERNKKLEKVWLCNNKIRTISSTFFKDLNELKFVGLRNNECINSFYHTKNFATMKDEIKNNCN